MKYSTVLFDLDGTLTDPVQGICGSVRYALEKAGRPVGPIESYHKYIGPPLLRSFEVYANATPEEAQELLGYYRERFSTVGLFENEVYPGIPELLRDLRRPASALPLQPGSRRFSPSRSLNTLVSASISTLFPAFRSTASRRISAR